MTVETTTVRIRNVLSRLPLDRYIETHDKIIITTIRGTKKKMLLKLI